MKLGLHHFCLLLGSIQSYVLDIENSNSQIITVDEAPVHIELFYESLCPGCRNFITTMLFPAFDKLKDSGIMKVIP